MNYTDNGNNLHKREFLSQLNSLITYDVQSDVCLRFILRVFMLYLPYFFPGFKL